MNFFISNLHRFLPQTIKTIKDTNFILPIGISFFTFQALSYVIDVYKGNVTAQKRLGYIGLYISLFPQLIAGPIVRYSTIMNQIENRIITFESFSEGVSRFIKGFNKKVLLANTLSVVADVSWASPDRSILLAWVGGLSYTLQILFDFSGYSDMAIGLGKMLGFNFLENFNYPYISKSVSEFWRRWHMSLQTWFRDYIYIPLGGSHVPKHRHIFNLFVVWGLTGIWHGANWTFLVWGLLYFILLTFEKFTGLGKKERWWGQIYTLFFVGMGWVLFRSDNISAATQYFRSMFGISGNIFINEKTLFYIREYGFIMLAGCICSTNLFEKLYMIIKKRGGKTFNAYIWGTNIIQFLLFIVSISYIVMNAHNPFIYFNF